MEIAEIKLRVISSAIYVILSNLNIKDGNPHKHKLCRFENEYKETLNCFCLEWHCKFIHFLVQRSN